MTNPEESSPEKLSKAAKKEQKKLEKASKKIESQIEEKKYLKTSIFILVLIDFLVFAGVLFLTTSLFGILLVFGYIILITLIALVPVTIEEYLRVARKPPALVRFVNWFLEKILPFNHKTMKTGPSILIIFTYLVSLGGFIAIGVYIFADSLSQNPNIYDYIIAGTPPGQYGFFSFVSNSSVNSLVPAILWNLIVFIPVVFCLLFLVAALYYRNNEPAKLLNIVILSPLIVLLPLFLTAPSITSPSIVIAVIFLVAWLVTLRLWYRFTKRTALICLSLLFTQTLASFLMFYNFIFIEVRDPSYNVSGPIDTASYYNYLFLTIWFGVLILIPLITKIFDNLIKGKVKIVGVLIAVGIAVVFQYYFFDRFRTAIYDSYTLSGNNLAEIFVGSGFFFFYIYLILIPLFFIFGYFQIGIARSLYRSLRDFGKKHNHINLFRILGTIFSVLFIFGILFVYYFFLYTPQDYQNMFSQITSLYNGDLIYYLTLDPNYYPFSIDYNQLFEVSSLAITIGLLAYSSYSGAHNFSLSTDKIEPDIKRFGIFNFILFTSPQSYRTRVIFSLSLIFVFLGISTIFAFLKIHTLLFAGEFGGNPPPSLIIFATIDGLKLGISIIGVIVAIVIFFSILYRQRKF